MVASNRDTRTLANILSEYLAGSEGTFLIIYDTLSILVDLLHDLETKQDEYKVLSIEASKSPAEFINRTEIVDDFDENTGWYKHGWIIHVHGEQASMIEAFNSFFYYQLVGNVIKVDNFPALLEHRDFGLLAGKNAGSILETQPDMQKYMVNYFADIPVSAYINSDGSLNEKAAWLIILSASLSSNPAQQPDSPSWTEISKKPVPIVHEHVLLELVYHLDPGNPPSLDEKVSDLVNAYINVLLADINITDLPASATWQENLANLIRYIFQNVKPSRPKKPAAKKKKGSLESFAEIISDEPRVPKVAVQFFTSFLDDWTSNADQTLNARFQQWAAILRNQQSSISISSDKLQELASQPSLSGMIDIELAVNALDRQGKEHASDDEWLASVDELIKVREQSWRETARIWWSQKSLFHSTKADLSVHELWHFARLAGLLLSWTIPDDVSWLDVAGLAWKSEKCYLDIVSPSTRQIFSESDCFKSLVVLIDHLDEKYATMFKTLSSLFARHFKESLINHKELLYHSVSENAWKTSVDAVKAGHTIGFVFADAMRRDLALEVKAGIERALAKEEPVIVEKSIVELPALGMVPTVTILGWTQALQDTDYMFVKLLGENIISGVVVDSQNVSLNTQRDREDRVARLLEAAGKQIEILHVEPSTLKESLSNFRTRNKDISVLAVPIVWYDKFDNHDFTLDEFLANRDLLVNEIVDIVHDLHAGGVERVFILADHGFIFANNNNPIVAKPVGVVHKRHSISSIVPTRGIEENNPDWHVFSMEELDMTIDGDAASIGSIITPKENLLFKKSRIDGDFYIHGGLSYLECDLMHLSSYCVLKPVVSIESIEVINHDHLEISPEQTAYYLQVEGTTKTLHVQVTMKKKPEGAGQLRPLVFTLVANDDRIKIQSNQDGPMNSGTKRKFKISIDNEQAIKEIELNVKTSDGDIIETRSFRVLDPAAQGSDSLF